MSRVSTEAQFTRYELLREVYIVRREAFSHLSPTSQWALYRYYQPNKDHLPESLKAHQHAVAKTEPSLPHRAGKAYQQLLAAGRAQLERKRQLSAPLEFGHQTGKKRERNITVRGLVLTQPNLDKLAQVLIQVAERQLRLEQEKRAAALEQNGAA